MDKLTWKVATTVGAAVASLSLAASSAFAFECYNASRAEQGNEAAAGAAALISFEEALALFCGLDEDEAAAVIEQMGEAGFETDFLINGHALMAGGLERNGKGEEKLHDDQAIDHLSEEFFAALFAIAPSCAEE